jgi:hypothetical protein
MQEFCFRDMRDCREAQALADSIKVRSSTTPAE